MLLTKQGRLAHAIHRDLFYKMVLTLLKMINLYSDDFKKKPH